MDGKIDSTNGLIDDKSIKSCQLLSPKSTISKPYVYPFLFIYPVYLYYYLTQYDVYFKGREWTFVYTLTIVSIHSLIWLLPHWNMDLNSKFNFQELDNSVAKNLDLATNILIIAAPNCGLSDICKIEKKVNDNDFVSFVYQKRRYLYHEDIQKFSPPKFEIDESPKISQIQDSVGLIDSEDGSLLENLRKTYGLNKFDIPIPTFAELFKEHAIAPFFVFQLFSVALWLMDDMWYLSLFSLFMLVSFECTTVWQRRSTMVEFQSMGIPSYNVFCFRNSKWVELSTEELLPGDIVSVTRTEEEYAIPCDLILLDGSCIVNEAMLSGESTPLLKESIKLRNPTDSLDIEGLDKNSILHGGTMCLQVTKPTVSKGSKIPLAPNDGAFAMVTKTGFETSQGSLVRIMIFSSERMSVANKEAFFFILFLLVFAIIASWYVWVEGTKMGRIQSKLILDCIIVITSVVPPELPMELTMAVNNSLAALGKYYIYCTEPFRIPLAGRIDVCCFDKTGTLTGEDLVFEGLAGLVENTADFKVLQKCAQVDQITVDILGSAHALVKLDDGEIVGDPMEKETLKASSWKLSNTENDLMELIEKPSKKVLRKIKIMRRFQFSSSLKRSSSISKILNTNKILVSVKGAPETIRGMLTNIPENYDETFKFFTRSGSRVLALAYKYLDDSSVAGSKLNTIKRESVESKLIFGGFIVFHCPMKADAVETIKMLNESSHRCIMITGDNPLTAIHVAKNVEIVKRETLILDKDYENEDQDDYLIWKNVEETISKKFIIGEPIDESLFKTYDLCLTGFAINKLIDHPDLKKIIRNTWIYARVSPANKEFILNQLKEMDYKTLMCGDGTNDVGALKQAHIGIALLNATEDSMKKLQETKKIEAASKIYQKQCELMKRWNQPQPKIPLVIAHLHPPGPLNPHYLKAVEKHGITIDEDLKKEIEESTKQELVTSSTTASNNNKKLGDQIMESMQELESETDAPTLKLGDASVAAPFTSKLANVSAVVHVIRQGRCALVSTIQMYKILALNCLISAYSLSYLYLAGIKFGDGQATASGLLLSVCFLSISRGKSLDKLSKERPQPGIFNIYIMGSILGQFAVHLATLIYINREVYILEPREPQVDLEKEFKPSLLNTAMFLLQLSQQVATFVINYQGPPFKESIRDNKGMWYGLLGVSFLAFSGATEFVPEMNEALQFVPMTYLFKLKLTLGMLLDIIASWSIELVLKYFFMDFKSSDIAIHDEDEGEKSLSEKKND
ncbi:hypothetical protein BVG19_g4895 [[Candida] boidinii]|nr:hypothetical protein BVG19_g4895 [[Candida] boidinii]OWB53511.1 hypothetical protein B5S27_g5111 [[Candida] boidinii]OWB69066.1 hypothetical protein B5S30_g4463 [[Candida] boidinii]OWB86000.1 hypothetical protein B5S33_g4678 [[Candida] boidinii]